MTPSPLPRVIADFCRDCFLLARYAPPVTEGVSDGKAWERAVENLIWRPTFTRRQRAGTFGLFGMGSASGVEHELDGVGHGPEAGVWVEAKARAALGKGDVALFELKCRDLYVEAIRRDPPSTTAARWWPVLVSSEPVSDSVRRLCLATGILLCEPEKLPLPALLRIAANPEADLHLDEPLLQEAVRLFEPGCRSMQERLAVEDRGRSLRLSIASYPSPRDFGDALFAQDELTADLLDHMELEAPGALESRAICLASRLRTRGLMSGSGQAT